MYSILIIDDNEDILYLLSAFLKDFFKVFSAPNGTKGLELYFQKKPDLVLVDYLMPDITGVEVAKKIREQKCKTVLILLSAYSDTIQNEISQTKFDLILKKPIKFPDLLNSLKSFLPQNK